MVAFTAVIKKFEKQGEKTGWTYIDIPADIAEQIKPGTRKSFRVKGKLDHFHIKGIALLPMGGGAFIMALNASLRKGMQKGVGATVQAQLAWDGQERAVPAGFLECLSDEPAAQVQYERLPISQKHYFTAWIENVKSETAKARRMAQAVTALAKGQDFGQMVRSLKKNRAGF